MQNDLIISKHSGYEGYYVRVMKAPLNLEGDSLALPVGYAGKIVNYLGASTRGIKLKKD